MGNQTSIPEGFERQAQSLDRLQRNSIQSSEIGNPDPPSQDPNIRNMLAAASPKGMNLSELMNTDNSKVEEQAAKCRSYQGLKGLRELQLTTSNRTALEPGCGWAYKKSGVNRGVFGIDGDPSVTGYSRGPLLGGAGQADALSGAQFYMDLEKAEIDISSDIVGKYTTCKSMANAPDIEKQVIGFCKDSGRVIPVQGATNLTPRFPQDKNFRCSGDIISPANTASCPAPSKQAPRVLGFQNPEPVRSASLINYQEAFSVPNWAIQNNSPPSNKPSASTHGIIENFVISDSEFETCRAKGTLDDTNSSKACVALAAKQAGFIESGSFLKYMASGARGRPPAVFNNYTKKVPGTQFDITQLMSNKYTVNDLVNIFTNVVLNMSSSDRETAEAAKDIVAQDGNYANNFDLCSWFMNPSADKQRINLNDPVVADCLQKYWRQTVGKRVGGDSRGTKYPSTKEFQGKTIGEFKKYFNSIAADINSTDKDKQASAIAQIFGTNTYGQQKVSGKAKAPLQDCVTRPSTNDKDTKCPPFYTADQDPTKMTYTQNYAIIQQPLAGGKPCVLKTTEKCNPPLCVPVNCVEGWQWSPCDKTCGDGTQTGTWRITQYPNRCGRKCTNVDGATTQKKCTGTECKPSDCKYTTSSTGCPTGVENCGKELFNITTYTLDPTNPPQANSLCPLPNPKQERCPTITCPPPPPPPPPRTANTRILTVKIGNQQSINFLPGLAFDTGASTQQFRLLISPKDANGKDISWWTAPLSTYIAKGYSPQVVVFRASDGNIRTLNPAFNLLNNNSHYILEGSSYQYGAFYKTDDVLTLQYEYAGVPKCYVPPPPPPPPVTIKRSLTIQIVRWDGGSFADGRAYWDAGAPSSYLRILFPPRDVTGKHISWWMGPLAFYAASGSNPTVTITRLSTGQSRTVNGWNDIAKIVRMPGFRAGSFYTFQGRDSTPGVSYSPGEMISLEYEDPGMPVVDSCKVLLFYSETYGASFYPYRDGTPGMLPTYSTIGLGDYDTNSFIDIPDVTNVSMDRIVANTRPIRGQIRSVRVGKGVQIIAYSGNGFSGQSMVISQDTPVLNFNIVSFKVVSTGSECTR